MSGGVYRSAPITLADGEQILSNRVDQRGRLLTSSAAVDASGNDLSVLPAGTDRSGSIAVAGTAQPLAPANANRKSLTGQNISANDLWINETGGNAAIDGAGSYKIVAGAFFKINTNRAISIVGATLGQKYTATET